MKHRVIVLRVVHALAGRVVPFDRIYFFEKESEHIVPRAFDHALVIHPNKPFADILGKVSTSAYHPVPGKAYPMTRAGESELLKEIQSSNLVDYVVDNYKKYVIVIPILMHKAEEGRPGATPGEKPTFPAILPGYLNARLKMPRGVTPGTKLLDNDDFRIKNLRRMSMDTFTAHSYYLARHEVFKPICAACRDSLNMLAGECFVGHENCYNGLMRQDVSTIRKNMRAYTKRVMRFNEPEIVNEQLC